MTSSLPPLEGRAGWGGASASVAHVVHARSGADVADAFALAREHGTTVIPWGAGRSYGDAPLNDGGIVLDMSAMTGILAWDAGTGIVTAQPGVTLQQLWQRILPDGWWPAVVSCWPTGTRGLCTHWSLWEARCCGSISPPDAWIRLQRFTRERFSSVAATGG